MRSATFVQAVAENELPIPLPKLTPKQASYLDVPVEGPYKSEHYRY